MGSEKNILPWYVTIHKTQFTALGKYYSTLMGLFDGGK